MTETLIPPPSPAEHKNTQAQLRERSAANIADIKASYVNEAVAKGQFDTPQAASDALSEQEAAVAADHKLTINMTASSLDHFLTVGGLETAWDAARRGGTQQVLGELTLNNKNMGDGYDDARRAAEDGIRHYAPEDALRHEPVYAALAGPNESQTGAAPSYGKFWIELGDAHAERAVYSFSDSLASVVATEEGVAFDPSTILDANDAVTAKAIVDLVQNHHKAKGVQMVAGAWPVMLIRPIL